MCVELWSFPAFGGLKPITHANSRPPHSLKRFTSDHWVNPFVMTRVHILPKTLSITRYQLSSKQIKTKASRNRSAWLFLFPESVYIESILCFICHIFPSPCIASGAIIKSMIYLWYIIFCFSLLRNDGTRCSRSLNRHWIASATMWQVDCYFAVLKHVPCDLQNSVLFLGGVFR